MGFRAIGKAGSPVGAGYQIIGGGGTPAPTPTPSMAGILDAYLFDPADITKFKQDSAGTTAVAANGDPIGKALDLSANARHLTQATSGARPLYKTSGGKAWIEGDGVDDCLLSGTWSDAQPWSRASAFRLITGAAQNDLLYGPGVSTHDAGNLIVFTLSGSTFSLSGYDESDTQPVATGLSLDTDYILLEFHNAGASTFKLFSKTGSSLGTFTGNPGAQASSGFGLFSNFNQNRIPPARCYGVGAKAGAFTTQNETDLIAALVARIP